MNDPILYWNHVALEANRADFTREKPEQGGPTLSSRALAIVHLAMYDAYAGVINDPANLPHYLSGLPSPPAGASPDEAWPPQPMRRFARYSRARRRSSTPNMPMQD